MGLFSKLFGGSGSGSDSGASAKDQQQLAALLAQCDDPDPKKRAAACKALGDMGGKARAATEKLEELMNDEDGDVCNAAADAYARVERGF